MQAEDALARWKHPNRWRKPGRVALANVEKLNPDKDPLHATLLASGAEVITVPLRDESGAVNPAVADSDVVVTEFKTDADLIAALRATRHLCRPYVGFDDIDVEAATAHGILVTNVPDAINEEVANQTLAMILGANRQIVRIDKYVRSGEWARVRLQKPADVVLHRPTVETLGLVGFGVIGRTTAARARPFGYRVIAYDPYQPDSVFAEAGVERVSLEELLRQSDVVSLHTFLSPETRHLINAETLALMKPTAWLVNTSRGPVVDEQALITALQEKRLGGACLDVMENEPLDPSSPLVEMDNVILASHVGGYSAEGWHQLRTRGGQIGSQVATGGLPQRHTVINKALYDQLAALPELAGIPRH